MAIAIAQSDQEYIKQFFPLGVAAGHRYMLIVGELSVVGFWKPYYYKTEEQAEQGEREHRGSLMRIFDLWQDIEMQLDAKIPLYLPMKLRQLEMEKCFGNAEIMMDGRASSDGANGENFPDVRTAAAKDYGNVLEMGFHAISALRLGQLLFAGKKGCSKTVKRPSSCSNWRLRRKSTRRLPC